MTNNGYSVIIIKYLGKVNIAEWSSLVARRAHNPKVVGSSPASATSGKPPPQISRSVFLQSANFFAALRVISFSCYLHSISVHNGLNVVNTLFFNFIRCVCGLAGRYYRDFYLQKKKRPESDLFNIMRFCCI